MIMDFGNPGYVLRDGLSQIADFVRRHLSSKRDDITFGIDIDFVGWNSLRKSQSRFDLRRQSGISGCFLCRVCRALKGTLNILTCLIPSPCCYEKGSPGQREEK